jgi:hypothetical protein
MYIIARMILGVGILFCIISGAALIGELGHPKERAVLTSLFNSSYFIGQILASAIAIGTENIKTNWAWRLPSLLQICPSLLQIFTVFFLPESPRYLISHDRDDDARKILVQYHAEGDASSLLVQAEMTQIRETIRTEMEVSKQSWSELLTSAGMRRRVLITTFIGLFTQMSGNTLLSYYSGELFGMMGFTEQSVKTRINIANACWSLINATIIALVVTRFKRRHMYMLSAALMCLVFIAITVSLERTQSAIAAGGSNSGAGISGLVWYFAFSPCYNIGNNALTYTYLVELWPYSHRSRGIGVQQIFGKLAGFFSTNVNSIALSAIKWRYAAIYCGWIFFELIIVFLLYPETSGRTLEELAFCESLALLPRNCTRTHRLTVSQCSRTTASTRGPLKPSRSRSTTATAPRTSSTRRGRRRRQRRAWFEGHLAIYLLEQCVGHYGIPGLSLVQRFNICGWRPCTCWRATSLPSAGFQIYHFGCPNYPMPPWRLLDRETHSA